MKVPFSPRPTREALASRSLQAIVRDYPETLADLREHGVSPEEYGERRLEDLDDPAGLLDLLEAATAWRPGPALA